MKATKPLKRPNPRGPLISRVHTLIPTSFGSEFTLRSNLCFPGMDTDYRLHGDGSIRRIQPKPLDKFRRFSAQKRRKQKVFLDKGFELLQQELQK